VAYAYGQITTTSTGWDNLQAANCDSISRWDKKTPRKGTLMDEHNHNTSYVEGMTNIPQRTIQEYVKTFRDHFSERARQTVKGRRFLPADIEKLQLIKRLRAERVPDDEIKAYLSGKAELPVKLAHQYKAREVQEMTAHSLELFGRAEYILERSEQNIADASNTLAAAKRELMQARQEAQALRNQLNRIEGTLAKFREWQIFVMKAEPDFNPYKQEDPNEPMPEITAEKKPGFLSKILK
jgi:DNA-binding transcriptional MerR regulator